MCCIRHRQCNVGHLPELERTTHRAPASGLGARHHNQAPHARGAAIRLRVRAQPLRRLVAGRGWRHAPCSPSRDPGSQQRTSPSTKPDRLDPEVRAAHERKRQAVVIRRDAIRGAALAAIEMDITSQALLETVTRESPVERTRHTRLSVVVASAAVGRLGRTQNRVRVINIRSIERA